MYVPKTPVKPWDKSVFVEFGSVAIFDKWQELIGTGSILSLFLLQYYFYRCMACQRMVCAYTNLFAVNNCIKNKRYILTGATAV